MLDIKIVHINMCNSLPSSQCIYLARGKKNQQFPLLANEWSHKDNTIAKYKVDSIEEAINCFTNNLVSKLKSKCLDTNRQMNALYKLTVELSKNGTVYYQCWCKHEPNLKPWHHSCHCDSLKSLVLSKFERDNPSI